MADEAPAPRRGRRALRVTVAVLLIVAVVATPIALHLGQERHDQLPFDLAAHFPDDRRLVGGEAVATTLAELVTHELDGPTGWRPNDFVLWGPRLWADNNANRQLGIIQTVRDSVRVLKDHLTKVSSDQFDQNLVDADTLLRNDALSFWLPSAESKYREGVAHLRAYVDGLGANPPRSKPLNGRNAELIDLFRAWSDLLGDAHGALYRPGLSAWETDDAFYHAQGFAYAIHHLMRAIRREYRQQVAERPILGTLM